MERLVQYIDSLEDLCFAIALKSERVKQVCAFLFFILASAVLQLLGIVVALEHPPLAMGIVTLLAVGALYHAVVVRHEGGPSVVG